MTTQVAGKALLQNTFGSLTVRPAGALPQTATGTLFNIVNGNVIITNLFAVITTAVQAQATTVKLNVLNSLTTTNADITLATGADLNAAAVGTIVSMPTLNVASPAALLVNVAGSPNPKMILGPGSLRAITVASSTGAWKWYCNYVALDSGAYVAAA